MAVLKKIFGGLFITAGAALGPVAFGYTTGIALASLAPIQIGLASATGLFSAVTTVGALQILSSAIKYLMPKKKIDSENDESLEGNKTERKLDEPGSVVKAKAKAKATATAKTITATDAATVHQTSEKSAVKLVETESTKKSQSAIKDTPETSILLPFGPFPIRDVSSISNLRQTGQSSPTKLKGTAEWKLDKAASVVLEKKTSETEPSLVTEKTPEEKKEITEEKESPQKKTDSLEPFIFPSLASSAVLEKTTPESETSIISSIPVTDKIPEKTTATEEAEKKEEEKKLPKEIEPLPEQPLIDKLHRRLLTKPEGQDSPYASEDEKSVEDNDGKRSTKKRTKGMIPNRELLALASVKKTYSGSPSRRSSSTPPPSTKKRK